MQNYSLVCKGVTREIREVQKTRVGSNNPNQVSERLISNQTRVENNLHTSAENETKQQRPVTQIKWKFSPFRFRVREKKKRNAQRDIRNMLTSSETREWMLKRFQLFGEWNQSTTRNQSEG